jgi:uncharacterized RDD family membrane protein YckC
MEDGKPERQDTDVVLERVGAQIIDNVTEMFLAVIALLAFVIPGGILGEASQMIGGLFAVVGLVLFIAVALGYSAVLEYYWKGQTVGKRLLGIKVVREDGEEIGAEEAVIRNLPILAFIVPYIGVLLYIAALVSMAATDRRQRLFDQAAGTVVIEENQ